MKLYISWSLVMIIGTSFAHQALGKMKPKLDVQVGTEFRFSDAQVGGKYQMGAEGLAQVDQEKNMISLVQPKRDFKDRIQLFGEEN